MFDNVYLTAGGREETIVESQGIVTGLFSRFYADPTLMPATYHRRYTQAGDVAGRARAVADYVAGMTDRFARNPFREAPTSQSAY